jgi:predicted DNA-binding protein
MSQRPLSPDGGEAPQLRTRLPRSMDARLREIARRRGCTVAVVVREALERHLPELEGTGPPGRAA